MTNRQIIITKPDWFWVGFNLARGAAAFLGVLVFVSLAFDKLGWANTDNTDAPGHHSGMVPHTDHLTECQYLSTSNGALSPRLGRDGKQICQ